MSEEIPTPEAPMPAETTALSVLQSQAESLTAQLQTLASERDGLKTAIDAAARIAELEASIRDRSHFDKFAEAAKGANAKDKALKQLWRDAKDRGYKAELDDVDEKAVQAAVAKLKTEVDYAFDPELAATTQAAVEAARTTSRTKYGLEMRGEEPAGGGRAGRNQGADGTIITQEMRADPKFMLDPKNKEIIRDAVIGGRFRQECGAGGSWMSGGFASSMALFAVLYTRLCIESSSSRWPSRSITTSDRISARADQSRSRCRISRISSIIARWD